MSPYQVDLIGNLPVESSSSGRAAKAEPPGMPLFEDVFKQAQIPSASSAPRSPAVSPDTTRDLPAADRRDPAQSDEHNARQAQQATYAAQGNEAPSEPESGDEQPKDELDIDNGPATDDGAGTSPDKAPRQLDELNEKLLPVGRTGAEDLPSAHDSAEDDDDAPGSISSGKKRLARRASAGAYPSPLAESTADAAEKTQANMTGNNADETSAEQDSERGVAPQEEGEPLGQKHGRAEGATQNDTQLAARKARDVTTELRAELGGSESGLEAADANQPGTTLDKTPDTQTRAATPGRRQIGRGPATANASAVTSSSAVARQLVENVASTAVDSQFFDAQQAEEQSTDESRAGRQPARDVADSAARGTPERDPAGPLSAMGRSDATRAGSRVAAVPAEPNAAWHVDNVRFVQRVARAIQLGHERGGDVQLRLSPPELGRMHLDVAVKDGVLTARLETETMVAKNLVLDNLHLLRERLAQQDIKIERFHVDVMEQPSGGPGGQLAQDAHWRGQDSQQRWPTAAGKNQEQTQPPAQRARRMVEDTQLNVVI